MHRLRGTLIIHSTFTNYEIPDFHLMQFWSTLNYIFSYFDYLILMRRKSLSNKVTVHVVGYIYRALDRKLYCATQFHEILHRTTIVSRTFVHLIC